MTFVVELEFPVAIELTAAGIDPRIPEVLETVMVEEYET
jgi:hypothetical protein